jgi:hypothetical protein
MGISKPRILFHADFESVEKVLKKCTQKKVFSKNMMEICTFFFFTHVHQTCFADNFFVAFFNNFFNGFRISVKFCVFLSKIFFVIFALFKKRLKNQKMYLVNVS